MTRDRTKPRDQSDQQSTFTYAPRQTRILQIRAFHLLSPRRTAVAECTEERKKKRVDVVNTQYILYAGWARLGIRATKATYKKLPHSPRNVPAATMAKPGPRPHTSPQRTAIISCPNNLSFVSVVIIDVGDVVGDVARMTEKKKKKI